MSDECDEMRTRVVGWLLGKEAVGTLLWGEARTVTDDGVVGWLFCSQASDGCVGEGENIDVKRVFGVEDRDVKAECRERENRTLKGDV